MLNRDYELVPTIGDHGLRRALRLALQALAVIWSFVPTRFSVLFCAAGILLGALVGAMGVILPLQWIFAPISLIVIVVVLIFFTFPEMRSVPIRAIAPTFFTFVIVEMTLPIYIAITAPGLPFISVIRLAMIVAACPFLISVAGSAEVRQRIKTALSADKPLTYAIYALFIAFALSIPTSLTPFESTKVFVNFCIDFLFPFFACVFVMDSERRQDKFLRIAILCAIFATILACIEYRIQHRFLVDLMPQSVIEKDPKFAVVLHESLFRNGRMRAASYFMSPLSFGEYCSLIFPVTLYFLAYSRNAWDRILGLCGALAMLVGVYVANAKGGVVGVLVGLAAFVLLYTIKAVVRRKRSLVGPWFVSMLPVIFSIVPAMMLVSHTFSTLIIGSGGENSAQDRFDQWALGWPKILSRPLTGWGLANSGTVVDYKTGGIGLSVDSYPLSLLVDAGMLGLIAFYAIFGIVLWRGAWIYLRDSSPSSAKAIALVSAFLAFLVQRTMLSQTENFTNIFMFLGLFIALEKICSQRVKSTQTANNSVIPVRDVAG